MRWVSLNIFSSFHLLAVIASSIRCRRWLNEAGSTFRAIATYWNADWWLMQVVCSAFLAVLLLLQSAHCNAAIVTRINPDRSAPAGGAAMFIYGSNLEDPTVASIGLTNCESYDYIASFVFACNAIPRGVGANIYVQVSNSAGQSSLANVFSYLPPLAVAAIPTAVAHISSIITVRGTNFGTYDSTLSSSILRNSLVLAAPAIKYISDSHVELLLKPNGGNAFTAVVTVGNQVTTILDAFSYQAPSASSLIPCSLGTIGGFFLLCLELILEVQTCPQSCRLVTPLLLTQS
jgi:hypothetical protein